MPAAKAVAAMVFCWKEWIGSREYCSDQERLKNGALTRCISFVKNFNNEVEGTGITLPTALQNQEGHQRCNPPGYLSVFPALQIYHE